MAQAEAMSSRWDSAGISVIELTNSTACWIAPRLGDSVIKTDVNELARSGFWLTPDQNRS